MLPSRYISTVYLPTTANCYFDTGVFPSNDLDIDAIFRTPDTGNTYLFGARNSNSNTSAGQINLLVASTSYIGYASARISVSNMGGRTFFAKRGNGFETKSGYFINDKTGATTEFTGTRSMFILAMNNAGSPNYGSSPVGGVYSFAVSQNGTKVKDYFPVYDTETQTFGLYDFVNDEFVANSGSGSFTMQNQNLLELAVNDTEFGDAYIDMPFGKVMEQYCFTYFGRPYSPIVAVPNDGYAFLNWTDQNGNVFSTDRIISSFAISEDTVLTANFIKVTDDKQQNSYSLVGLQYGIGAIESASDPDGRESNIFTLVDDFTIVEDSLSKSTSKITCRSVPTLFQEKMPVFLFDPKGKLIWGGMIQSIEDNVLTCREALGIFDGDFIFTPTTSVGGLNLTQYSLPYALTLYTNSYGTTNSSGSPSSQYVNYAGRRMMNAFGGSVLYDDFVSYNKELNMFFGLPSSSDTKIGNMEDYYIGISNSFDISFKTTLEKKKNTSLPDKGEKWIMRILIENPLIYGTIVMGDNMDEIRNVEVIRETQETTVLQVYNSSGSSLRGIYGMKTDGTVAEINPLTSSFFAYNECKMKVLMSDDNIKTLIAENLTNTMYNHKITFDLDLSNHFIDMDDLIMGRRVDFYVGNKLYKSIVTGKEYSSNNGKITSVKVTLGNVRTKLTTKLNLRNTK